MMDEEIRQALCEVREMKKMCGNINMKLTNIVTQRGQDWKKKLEAEYQRGLDDAWEAARKIALMDTETSENVTGYFGLFRIMENLTPMQAIEKLKAYEEKRDDKFEFGDEIISSYGVKGCVISKDNEGYDTMYALFNDCRVPQYVPQSNYRKTGKHYDIEKFLGGLNHDD